MKQTNEPMNEAMDKDILYSKTVKAGKRVYYIDVKRDRRNAYYLSITESKRVKEGSVEERPVFEKHKIFLYREDMEKFMAAIKAATDYAIENAPVAEVPAGERHWDKPEDVFSAVDRGDAEGLDAGETGVTDFPNGKIKLDLDF